MRTAARSLAVALVSALVLSGCIRVDMNITLNEDDTVSGDMVMAVQEGAGEPAGRERRRPHRADVRRCRDQLPRRHHHGLRGG
ncbi:LppM family (lipo)protein [Demequina litorisediminis]|uniref:LppM family (lipo)protein n=1 Tax=Demequina litorisediminis TaxID=1849022 RepID=UPI0024E1755B|nr:hypothetical protein [Demequina litorisediminis]